MNKNNTIPYKFLTREEVATILRISKTKSYQLFNREDFPSIKIDGILRINEDEFKIWLNNQRH